MHRPNVRALAIGFSLVLPAVLSAPEAAGDEKTKSPAGALGRARVSVPAPKPSMASLEGKGRKAPGGDARVRPGLKWPRFKANLEALNARLKGSLSSIRALGSPAPTPTRSNLTAGAPGGTKGLGALGGGPGPATGLAPAGARNLETIDCVHYKTPVLKSLEGEVTPGGFLLLKGSCFGTGPGQVFVEGRFPGGALRLPSQEWTDHYATAVVPDLPGTPDQEVHVKVYSGGAFSNALPAGYVAPRERREVPLKYLRNVLCTHQDICGVKPERGAFAFHSATNEVEDIDTWELRLPEGCELEEISWDVKSMMGTGWTRYAGGAENGPPNYAKWNMRWRSDCEHYATLSDSCFVTYVLHVFAWGPVGAMTP